MTDAQAPQSSYAVVLFHSTSHAIRGERVLVARGFDCRLVPVPRQISSDCGVCLRMAPEDVARAREVLEAVGLEVDAVQVL
jgi:hypothetical protein